MNLLRSRDMRRALALLVLVSCAHTPAPRPLEEGQLVLHKFLQPIGEERWSISPDHVLRADFQFSDRGTKVPLSATLRFSADGAPIAAAISGRTSRMSGVDRKTDAVPAGTFPIVGYAPVALQMMLVRHWRSHGEPAEIATPWGLKIHIERRGRDEVGGRSLERYSLSGLIWGLEWIWLDEHGQVAAMVGNDAEFDHFEAVRADLEPYLRTFVARAAQDGMAAFAELARGLELAAGKPIAIVGARLWDGTGRTIEDATVVVDGDHIVAAGRGVTVPSGAVVVDGKGGTIIPGMWDTHAHFEQVEWGPIYLAAGVTSARDCGNEFEFITAVRDAIEDGRGLGPRLTLAGIVDGDGPMAIGVDRIHGPADIEPMVERYKRAGFAQMKIYSSMPPALVPAIASAAHNRGMTVTGHVPNGMNAIEGIRAGMDQINHVGFIVRAFLTAEQLKAKGPGYIDAVLKIDLASPRAKEIIAEFARRRTVIEPTIALSEMSILARADFEKVEPGVATAPPMLAALFEGENMPSEMRAKLAAGFERTLALLGALHRAGVRILAGTDQAVPGHSLHRELELFVRAGFTPAEALSAATVLPAQLFGGDATIEPGKKADLVLLDGNPLENISAVRKIRRVVSRGRLFDPAPLWQSVGFAP